MNLESVKANLSKILSESQAQLTHEQSVEFAKMQNKINGLFNGFDMENPDLEKLEKNRREIEKIGKNLINGINSNK